VTGWSPEEIEMVLLHELAHVRRWDNLLNLVQRIIESLLFFHPAVWLVSNWVRREREACCDALVIERTNRPHAYAELLVALAAQMPRSVLFHPAASSAMAAGPLRSRIRRILGLEDDPMLISGRSFALMLTGLLIAATLAVLYLPTIGQAEQSFNEATKNTEVIKLAEAHRDDATSHEGRTDRRPQFQAGRKFPSLEEQKLADLVWKRLGLELEPIGEADLKRVQALGYDGGLAVRGRSGLVAKSGADLTSDSILTNDILVGLHVWPTTRMEDAAEVLQRDDLAELNPLKFYVVRSVGVEERDDQVIMGDIVRTGRISISVGSGDFGFGRGATMHGQPAPQDTQANPFAAPAKAATPSDPDLPRYELPSAEGEASGPAGSQRAIPELLAQRGQTKHSSAARKGLARGAANKDTLRYDGKSFDEWRNDWQTELSTENRIEAVKALAAFGRAGYGKQAAEAVLDVVRQYDWQYLEDPPIGKLQELASKSFAGTGEARMPLDDALPVLVAAIKSGDKKVVDFAQYVVYYFGEDERSKARLLELSRDDELGSIRTSVLYRLSTIHQLNPDARIEKRMVEALSEGLDAARTAILALYPPHQTIGMAYPGKPVKRPLEYRPQLAELLSGDDPAIRFSILESLAALKSKAGPALPKIYPFLLDDDAGIVTRAYLAIVAITGSSQDAVDYLHSVASERGPAELMPLLQSKSSLAARLGRQTASTLDEKSATQLVSLLQERLNSDRSADPIATIRALAAMGPKAQPAWDKLMELLASTDDNTRIAAAAAIKMIVGKDQYQKPIADVLGRQLGITVVKTPSGEWGALPRDDAADDGKAFNDFTEAVIKEQQELLLPEVSNGNQ
jgi:hypothetical protein